MMRLTRATPNCSPVTHTRSWKKWCYIKARIESSPSYHSIPSRVPSTVKRFLDLLYKKYKTLNVVTSTKELARMYGCTRRWIVRLLKEVGKVPGIKILTSPWGTAIFFPKIVFKRVDVNSPRQTKLFHSTKGKGGGPVKLFGTPKRADGGIVEKLAEEITRVLTQRVLYIYNKTLDNNIYVNDLLRYISNEYLHQNTAGPITAVRERKRTIFQSLRRKRNPELKDALLLASILVATDTDIDRLDTDMVRYLARKLIRDPIGVTATLLYVRTKHPHNLNGYLYTVYEKRYYEKTMFVEEAKEIIAHSDTLVDFLLTTMDPVDFVLLHGFETFKKLFGYKGGSPSDSVRNLYKRLKDAARAVVRHLESLLDLNIFERKYWLSKAVGQN